MSNEPNELLGVETTPIVVKPMAKPFLPQCVVNGCGELSTFLIMKDGDFSACCADHLSGVVYKLDGIALR